MHENVRRWTSKKGINLFDKDFIFIPINESSHWYLAVVCFPGQRIKAKFPQAAAFPAKLAAAEAQEESSSDSETEEVPIDEEEGFADGGSATEGTEKTLADFQNRPLITVFDSLGGTKKMVFENLPPYFRLEYKAVYEQDIAPEDLAFTTKMCRVPQQANGYDCGVFVLHFVEMFLRSCQDIQFLTKLVSSDFTFFFLFFF